MDRERDNSVISFVFVENPGSHEIHLLAHSIDFKVRLETLCCVWDILGVNIVHINFSWKTMG